MECLHGGFDLVVVVAVDEMCIRDSAQAVADAAHADGVFHCVAAALHIAADIQALADVALGAGGVLLGEGVAVLVALQACLLYTSRCV